MENIFIAATDSTPEVSFDIASNILNIKGESYPENVSTFYGSVFEKLKAYFSSLKSTTVVANIELIYFNSSSVKVIMNLFEMLDECAKNGNKVTINWFYNEDDDTIKEFGEEFGEDITSATFEMREMK